MKALITGANGFVGQYLAEELLLNGYEVWGGTRGSSLSCISEVEMIVMNYSDQSSLIKQIDIIRPDVIFHLSALSSVKQSWSQPFETFQSNVMNSINLFEAVKASSCKEKIKIVCIGSSEEYGYVNTLPINEATPTNPINPYGLSKLTIGKLALQYAASEMLDIIHVRAFNHIGPGQALGFVTSDFAKQIVDIEERKKEPIIYVGDLSSKRDFTDVRDVVVAYRFLFEKGISGNIYNVCSGKCISIDEILKKMSSLSTIPIEIRIDPNKLRPVEINEYYGCNLKLKKDTGWEPLIDIDQSLKDILMSWKTNQ
jgi:GDP-4-dehydro-6-deoxy-D-mannose reductase